MDVVEIKLVLTWQESSMKLMICSSYEDVVHAGRRNRAMTMADGVKEIADVNVNSPSELSLRHLLRRAHAVCRR